MVRIKHRYLLVQILYPQKSPSLTTLPTPSAPTLLASPDPTLSLHAPTPDGINIQYLLRLLRAQIQQLTGDYGAGICNPGLSIKYWSNATSTWIIRCERAAFRLVWAAVTFIRGLKVPEGRGRERDVECVMRVLRVSGTIRKCEEELIRRAKALCGRIKGIGAAVEAGVGSDGVVEVSDEEDGGAGARVAKGMEDVEMGSESE